MHSKAVQTGAESPELASMNWQRALTIGGVTLAALGSAAWILTRRSEAPPVVAPTAVASDAFTRWIQPAAWPEGLAVADSIACTLTAFENSEAAVVMHATSEPTALPEGWSSQAWNGGWLLGPKLLAWEENPGTMARQWKPRTGGRTTQVLLPSGSVESWYERLGEPAGSERWVIESGLEAVDAQGVTLPAAWAEWYERIGLDGWEVAVGAYPTSEVEVDSLGWLLRGAWLAIKTEEGTLRAFGGVDSTEAIRRGGQWKAGVWYVPALDEGWMDVPPYPSTSEQTAAAFDFARRSQGEMRTGKIQSDGRLVWKVKSADAPAEQSSVSQPLEDSMANASANAAETEGRAVLGTARNHRSGKTMDLVLEDNQVIAMEGDRIVWDLEVEAGVLPQTWEVDMFRNGKYQVAIGAGKRFHLIDVLGRSVKGFPKKWSDGFSAFAVFDYDKNRQFRFLMAAPNGKLFNFRKEGERTPGWKFTPRSGRYIVSLAHLRIGPKDYIVAGQDDGTVRILSRTGEDRFNSPLRVPVNQSLAFRIGKNVKASTVLFVDEDGWVQERTIGSNEAVGMSRMTKGQSVRVEDRTGDGIPEVIVATSEGEEVWNARNQRVED